MTTDPPSLVAIIEYVPPSILCPNDFSHPMRGSEPGGVSEAAMTGLIIRKRSPRVI
jgi:hypothetical protein